MNEKHFHSLLQDKHRELVKRKQALREEVGLLGFEIRSFEHILKEARKSLPKDMNIWSLVDEKSPFEKLSKFTVMHKGEEVPFFSEAYLYETIGKEDARTILAFMKSIYEAAGETADF